jgi:hypothetical protein
MVAAARAPHTPPPAAAGAGPGRTPSSGRRSALRVDEAQEAERAPQHQEPDRRDVERRLQIRQRAEDDEDEPPFIGMSKATVVTTTVATSILRRAAARSVLCSGVRLFTTIIAQ